MFFQKLVRHKYLHLFLFVVFSIGTVLLINHYVKKGRVSKSNSMTSNATRINKCYEPSRRQSIKYFDDILDHDHQPESGKAIFFLPTACSKTGVVKLNNRQACAVESAALRNPNRDIFVVFASPVGQKKAANLPQFVDVLKKISNVHFRNMNISRFTLGTPIHEWFETNKLAPTNLFAQMSDILRVIILQKYGGFYLDLDVVVQRSFYGLGENFIGDDWSNDVNSAVFHINNFGIGKEVADKVLRNITNNFNATVFNSTVSRIFTKVLQDICKVDDRSLWTAERCSNFTLQPKELFFPVPSNNWTYYFNPSVLKKVLKKTKKSVLIHVWNDLSKNLSYPITKNTAYQYTAARHCPQVYTNSKYL